MWWGGWWLAWVEACVSGGFRQPATKLNYWWPEVNRVHIQRLAVNEYSRHEFSHGTYLELKISLRPSTWPNNGPELFQDDHSWLGTAHGHWWAFMYMHGYPYNPIEVHVYPCISRCPWVPIGVHGYLWMSHDIHGHPWNCNIVMSRYNDRAVSATMDTLSIPFIL